MPTLIYQQEVRLMSLEQFITDLLNVKADDIQEIYHLKQSDQSLILKVKLKRHLLTCPYCGKKLNIHGYYTRKLTHSTFANRKCSIHYMQRRCKCENCEITLHEQNPFSSLRESITHETKINVLTDLKYPEATYTSVASRYNLSTTQVIRIFDKHVNIPRKPLPEVLSIDEHYFPESDYDSLYCCLLMDFITGEIVDILPDRKKSYLINYFSKIKHNTLDYTTTRSELNNVQYVSIDLSENFRSIAKTYFPKATICADSFHVIENLNRCFRNVRLKCRMATDNPIYKYFLIKFRFVFYHKTFLDNTPRYNKRLGEYINYRGIRDLLLAEFPELKVAYELREFYLELNSNCSIAEAPYKINKAISLFADSGISELDEFHNLLLNWREEIINSFTIINGKRINNSYIESKNRLLKKLISNANGFTNFKRTRNRILYSLNKDSGFKM